MKRLFVSSLLLFASLAAFAEAPQVGREELLKRAQAALDEVSKGPQIWTAKIREAPDYGIQADNFSFDEGGDEGTFYLKFPGKYRIRWNANNEAYCYDGQEIHLWNGTSENAPIKLSQTAFSSLVAGSLTGPVHVGAISQQELRFEGKKQPIILLDLESAQDPNRDNTVRIYMTGTGKTRIIGFRVPTERRSGYNPDYINYWLRDFHPEPLDTNIFKPH